MERRFLPTITSGTFFCDSGMIPWLLIWELISEKNSSLFELVSKQARRFIASEELNFQVADATRCINMIKNLFQADAVSIEELDGVSMSFETWRFDIRKSNTEPLYVLTLRLEG